MPSITAGVSSSFGSYTLYLDWSENVQPASNTSTITWNAYLRKNNSGDSSFNLDAVTRFYVEIAGVVRSDFNGAYDFRGPAPIGTTRGMGNGTTEAIGHASNGTGSVSARILMSGPGPITGGDSGYQTITFSDFDRTPTTPSFVSGSRTTNGTSFSTTASTGWSGGVNNSGPAVTWTLQRSTVANFSSGVVDIQSTTTSGAVLTSSSLDPNTTYYYRIRASNTDTSNTVAHPNPKFSSIITSLGVPGPPTSLAVTPSTTSESRFSLSWVAPTNTQGGVSRYDLFVNDVFVESTTSTSLTNIKLNTGGTAYTPGTSYNFRVAAKNSTNLNETAIANLSSSVTSNLSRTAPGKPYAPTSAPTFTVNGLDITVTSAAVSGNGGVSIDTGAANQGYYLQYQTSTTLNGTYSAWSTPVKMSDQTNRRHTLASLTPALFYKFRVYAANTVIFGSNGSSQLYYPHNNSSFTANFATTTTGYFLAAGGRRWNGTAWEPTAIAKRWDGSQWVAFTIAKRWNGSEWINLS
jgi:hypothetical protein